MSSFDVDYPEDMTAAERVYEAIFGKPRPEWEGIAIPRIEKFRRFIKASEIFKNLFQESEVVKRFSYKPEPFIEYCGGSVRILAADEFGALAVFENRESISEVSEFLKLVDEVEIAGEVLMDGKASIEISWYINDVFVGNPKE